MKFTRREFIRDGVAAFTVGFAAPAFLSDLARAQGASGRTLVVLYLSGGNDALSTLVPYRDPFYYSRRPTQAVPPTNVFQIGADRSGVQLGLHPRLAGLKQMFDAGHVALIQRSGYPQLEPIAFHRHRHLGDGEPGESNRLGLAGPLSRHAAVAGRSARGLGTVREVPRAMIGNTVERPGDSEPGAVRVLESEQHRRRRSPDFPAPR